MKIDRMMIFVFLTILSSNILHAQDQSCKNHTPTTIEVEMLNRSPTGNEIMVFNPPWVKICPGDTVHWKSVDMGHNSASLQSVDGGITWEGEINEDIKVTFNKEGVYFYQCIPHIYLGMAGMVIVGQGESSEKTENTIKTLGKKYNLAAKRLQKYFDEAKKR